MLALPTVSALATSAEDLRRMSDKLDQLDQLDFNEALDKAARCVRVRDFGCASLHLRSASKLAQSARDQIALNEVQSGLFAAREQVAQEERDAARRKQEIELAALQQREAEQRAERAERLAARQQAEREERAQQASRAERDEAPEQASSSPLLAELARQQQQFASSYQRINGIHNQAMTNIAAMEADRQRRQSEQQDRMRIQRQEADAERRANAQSRADADRRAESDRRVAIREREEADSARERLQQLQQAERQRTEQVQRDEGIRPSQSGSDPAHQILAPERPAAGAKLASSVSTSATGTSGAPSRAVGAERFDSTSCVTHIVEETKEGWQLPAKEYWIIAGKANQTAVDRCESREEVTRRARAEAQERAARNNLTIVEEKVFCDLGKGYTNARMGWVCDVRARVHDANGKPHKGDLN